jgi:hypothetical protein
MSKQRRQCWASARVDQLSHMLLLVQQQQQCSSSSTTTPEVDLQQLGAGLHCRAQVAAQLLPYHHMTEAHGSGGCIASRMLWQRACVQLQQARFRHHCAPEVELHQLGAGLHWRGLALQAVGAQVQLDQAAACTRMNTRMTGNETMGPRAYTCVMPCMEHAVGALMSPACCYTCTYSIDLAVLTSQAIWFSICRGVTGC